MTTSCAVASLSWAEFGWQDTGSDGPTLWEFQPALGDQNGWQEEGQEGQEGQVVPPAK